MTREQSDYVNKHLPYRLNSLLASDLIAHRRGTNIPKEIKENCYQDSLVLEPAFEISIIFGRALLHFLGIDYDRKTSELKIFSPKSDDITISNLFPGRSFCPLDDPTIVQYKKALCLIIKIANKSVAHLTTVVSNDQEHLQLEDARKSIYRLVLKYVPEIDKSKIWWYTQVEK